MMRETKKIRSFFKNDQNHKVIHHLKGQFLKGPKLSKKEKSRSNWNQMKIRKSTKYTRALRLFHDQKIKIKNTYNHKINERTHSSRILSKTQEQWVCLSNWSQKKKEMNQMHKINEILLKKKKTLKKPTFQSKNARASPVS